MRLRFGPGLPASGLVRRPGGPGARLDCGARLDSGARLDCGARLDSGARLDCGARLDSGARLTRRRLDSGARLDCGAPCPALDRVG